jgi:hypothetical protein
MFSQLGTRRFAQGASHPTVALIVALIVGIVVRRVTMDATRIRACAAPRAKADSLRFTRAWMRVWQALTHEDV